MNILVFLQGTVIMHNKAAGLSREEIIKQVKEEDQSVRDYETYIPIGKAAQKLHHWLEQGSQISYLSALTNSKLARKDEMFSKSTLQIDKTILQRHNFPEGKIYHRNANETYQDVVRRIQPAPNILIEDNCESIGSDQITWPKLSTELKEKIKPIIVPEFSGIDNLPDNLTELKNK